MEELTSRFTGYAVQRLEDLPLVTGAGTFVDNLRLPGALHMVVVRCPFAHARILGVAVGRALEIPGVVAVYVGKDLLEDWVAPLPMIWSVTAECRVPSRWPLAVEEARHAGDGVAVVVAESMAAAKDGAEALEVDYEPLPAVVDVEEALKPEAPLVYPEFGTNRCFALAVSAEEDVDEVFRRADVRVARRFRQQRLLPSPIEPRAVAVRPEPGGDFLLWTTTQVPHLVKRTLGRCVGIPEHRLRVIAPDVGGVRREAQCLRGGGACPRPGQAAAPTGAVEGGAVGGGGPRSRSRAGPARQGCRHAGGQAPGDPSLGPCLHGHLPATRDSGHPHHRTVHVRGAYGARGYAYECTGVFTNQPPTGAYRGAGRPEVTYAIERMMDVFAREVGVDPIEIRRRNFLPRGEGVMNAAGIPYDSVDYERTLDRALELAEYEGWRQEQASRRVAGARRRIGVGVAFYVDSSGMGPSSVLSFTRYLSGGWEYARAGVGAGGKVEIATGSSLQGQGHVTVWSQLAAGLFGVGLQDVRVDCGDTALVPMGVGTFGSRSLIVGGTAMYLASQKVLAKGRRVAAHLLEVADEDVIFVAGRFHVAGAPERALSLAEVAHAAHVGHRLPEGMEPGESVVFDPQDWTYPFGAHVAVVEVDEETGQVVILRYAAVDDCGNVVNPMIVDGQIHGGLAQGMAQALFEEVVFTDDGQIRNVTFADYLVPSAADLPSFDLDRTVTPSPLNPLGAKGVGEAGAIAAPPAVMNAIHDALDEVEEIDMPATPERVWQALRGVAGRGNGADGGGSSSLPGEWRRRSRWASQTRSC